MVHANYLKTSCQIDENELMKNQNRIRTNLLLICRSCKIESLVELTKTKMNQDELLKTNQNFEIQSKLNEKFSKQKPKPEPNQKRNQTKIEPSWSGPNKKFVKLIIKLNLPSEFTSGSYSSAA